MAFDVADLIELDVPELLYPSQWPARPARCWNCSAGRASFETRPPYGLEKVGHSVCLLCGRATVRWRADGTRPVPLTHEQRHPRHGRPPNPGNVSKPKPKPPRGRCQRCGNETVSVRRVRCAACVAADATEGGTNTSRLLALLRDGQPHSRRDARAALGMTAPSLKKAIHGLRRRGVPIICDGADGMVLEPTP